MAWGGKLDLNSALSFAFSPTFSPPPPPEFLNLNMLDMYLVRYYKTWARQKTDSRKIEREREREGVETSSPSLSWTCTNQRPRKGEKFLPVLNLYPTTEKLDKRTYYYSSFDTVKQLAWQEEEEEAWMAYYTPLKKLTVIFSYMVNCPPNWTRSSFLQASTIRWIPCVIGPNCYVCITGQAKQ